MRPGQVRILTQREVARLADVRIAIRAARQTFKDLARGRAQMPPKLYLTLPRGDDFRAMPAAVASPPGCGVKWVNVHVRNPRRGLPTVMAVIVLNDPATGVPLAVMDGLWITKLRTAAVAAVAADALARRDSCDVGLIGCGAQADAQILALAAVRRLRQVRVWGYARGEAAAFCARMRRQLRRVRWTPVATLREAAGAVDILVTLTPSRRPLVRRAWVRPGTHINAIGADAPGKQELDPALLRAARVIVDDHEQARHAGEINVPVRQGQYDPRRVVGTLGEILLRRRPGRRTRSDITVFDSTGLAVHDVSLGMAVLRRAQRAGVGRLLPLWVA